MAILEIISNQPISDNYFVIRLKGGEKEFTPGQFVHLSVGTSEGMLLKRPISVFDYEDGIITLVYEVKGKGTAALSKMRSGELCAEYFLGNGFPVTDKKILIVGGGMGAAPLYPVAKRYKGVIAAYLGYASKDKIILTKEYGELVDTVITTDDGSCGTGGYVTDAVKRDLMDINPDVIYACGPLPMLKALKALDIPVYVSVEERKGCGIGACLTCPVKTVDGYKEYAKTALSLDIAELVL